jgi:hypothetical protein
MALAVLASIASALGGQKVIDRPQECYSFIDQLLHFGQFGNSMPDQSDSHHGLLARQSQPEP